jgi:pseudaminic acid cytidylyltransferase
MHNLAIIPARGGSKRIPRKNIREFLGKPIIEYSIEIALESGLFDEVMVSTDDQEIARIATQMSAKVPFLRSKKNSDDFATTLDVIMEVADWYKNKLNRVFDRICCIYPAAPLIRVVQLRKGFDLLNENQYDSVFPVVAFGFPVWRGLEINDDGKAVMVWPQHQNTRSQDLKKVYHDAGQWYWLNMNQIQNSIFTANSGSIELSEDEVQDIDTLTDWKLAEMKYRLLHEA